MEKFSFIEDAIRQGYTKTELKDLIDKFVDKFKIVDVSFGRRPVLSFGAILIEDPEILRAEFGRSDFVAVSAKEGRYCDEAFRILLDASYYDGLHLLGRLYALCKNWRYVNLRIIIINNRIYVHNLCELSGPLTSLPNKLHLNSCNVNTVYTADNIFYYNDIKFDLKDYGISDIPKMRDCVDRIRTILYERAMILCT